MCGWQRRAISEFQQAKVTFSVKGSPVRIPVALTWANRTELISASEVRGNVGILLNMDSLFIKKN
jgi:hypothetical protein